MPELPDIELYVAKLRDLLTGVPLSSSRMVSLFILRTVTPSLQELAGHRVRSVERLGKRVVLGFQDTDARIVIHLMVSGRFLWRAVGANPPPKITMAVFSFPHGQLVLTEASSKKRASIHVVPNKEALQAMDPGGVEPLECSPVEFLIALRKENRTLKRGLTNPRAFSGIGNAYSDEILWAAQLSPLRLTQSLTDDEGLRLREAAVATLQTWSARLLDEFANKFPGPGDVTAFRPDFAVHGKFGKPCPECGNKVQRIVYAENETNYCAECQLEGRILADRSLSRLLKSDWPRSLEEMEGL